jgi:hypothetical protein
VALNNLAFPVHPGFQQLLDSWCGSQIAFVDDVLAKSVGLHTTCDYEAPDHPFGCGQTATVTDLRSERGYCVRHFREVSR